MEALKMFDYFDLFCQVVCPALLFALVCLELIDYSDYSTFDYHSLQLCFAVRCLQGLADLAAVVAPLDAARQHGLGIHFRRVWRSGSWRFIVVSFPFNFNHFINCSWRFHQFQALSIRLGRCFFHLERPSRSPAKASVNEYPHPQRQRVRAQNQEVCAVAQKQSPDFRHAKVCEAIAALPQQ